MNSRLRFIYSNLNVKVSEYGRGPLQGENSFYVVVYFNDLKKLTIIKRLVVLQSHHTKSHISCASKPKFS